MRHLYTEEDKQWAKETIIAQCGGHVTEKKAKDINASVLYKKRFGRDIAMGSLISWLIRVEDPDRAQRYEDNYKMNKKLGKAGKNGKSVSKDGTKMFKVLEQANFVLYVFGVGVFGFDSKDEVKDYLLQTKPQAPIRLFENKPVAVKTKVEIEI